MRTAVIHDWLTTYAGAERALKSILKTVPEPELYTLINAFGVNELKSLGVERVKTSFLNLIPKVERLYKNLLPFMPLAVEQFDLSKYDLIISSSHAVAKGIIKRPQQLHICYCYTPIRYAWDLYHQYMESINPLLRPLASLFLHYVRLWDLSSSHRVDHFVAISRHVARRIWNTYRRRAKVIYPPVDVDKFKVNYAPREDFFVCVARNVPYKKLNLLIEAFKGLPSKKLILIGRGTEKLTGLSRNVEALGEIGREGLKRCLAEARAFIYVAEEDFGISMVEALACGTPVIAYHKGGASEIVEDGKNGVLFKEQSVSDIQQALVRFEQVEKLLSRDYIRESSERFSRERFEREFSEFLYRKLKSHRLT